MKPRKEAKKSLEERLRTAVLNFEPMEGTGGEPILTLEGTRLLVIEQHSGILEYGTERICVASEDGSIEVTGKSLCLAAMDREALRICGSIATVRYLDRG